MKTGNNLLQFQYPVITTEETKTDPKNLAFEQTGT